MHNKWLRCLPGSSGLLRSFGFLKKAKEILKSPFVKTYLPGHFYSPLPDQQRINDATENEFAIIVKEGDKHPVPDYAKELMGIDINDESQLELLKEFGEYHSGLPFVDNQQAGTRYYYNNSYFRQGDAVTLYSVMRHFKPRRIVEVGSGYSSAVILDTIDHYFSSDSIDVSFIEPHSERLEKLLTSSDPDDYTLLNTPVQKVETSVFERLDKNDILFIDSSHVAKFGSDVCHLIFEILPLLKPGVLVHFHDILWPFEYPKEWYVAGRAWNESYMLRSFLQYNNEFSILYFNSYMGLFHKERLAEHTPMSLKDTGGSIWLIKR